MGAIEEVEQETILDKDLNYFFSVARTLWELRIYCRLMLGKLAVLAARKFANDNLRTTEGQAILDGLAADLGIKKGTLLQYIQLWKRLRGIKTFSFLTYSDCRKAAFQKRPGRVLDQLRKRRRKRVNKKQNNFVSS